MGVYTNYSTLSNYGHVLEQNLQLTMKPLGSEKIEWSYVGLFAIPLLSIWGNLLVCLSVSLELSLRKRFNYFLVSLAVSDLLCSLLVMPVSAWKFVKSNQSEEPPREFCLAWYSLDVFFTASTIIHLCIISLDRYLALRDPFKSCQQKRKRSLVVQLLCAWLIPFGIACPLFVFALSLDKVKVDDNDTSFKGCGPHNAYFITIATVVTFFVPLGIMTLTYILTVMSIRKQHREAEDNLYGQAVASLVMKPKMAAYMKNGQNRNITTATESSTGSESTLLRSSFRNGNSLRNRPSTKSTTGSAGIKMTSSTFLSIDNPRNRISSPDNIEETQFLLGNTPQLNRQYSPLPTPPTLLSRKNSTVIFDYDTQSNISCNSLLIKSSMPSKDNLNEPGRVSNRFSPSRNVSLRKTLNQSIRSTPTFNSFQRKRRDNEARLKHISRSRKAIQTLGVLFGLFVVCYLPFFVTYLLDFFCQKCRSTTSFILPAFEWIGYAGSMFNPIVYHIFTPAFRRTFYRLMQCNCKRGEFSRRHRTHLRTSLNT